MFFCVVLFFVKWETLGIACFYGSVAPVSSETLSSSQLPPVVIPPFGGIQVIPLTTFHWNDTQHARRPHVAKVQTRLNIFLLNAYNESALLRHTDVEWLCVVPVAICLFPTGVVHTVAPYDAQLIVRCCRSLSRLDGVSLATPDSSRSSVSHGN